MICSAVILVMSKISPAFLALKDGPATYKLYHFGRPNWEDEELGL